MIAHIRASVQAAVVIVTVTVAFDVEHTKAAGNLINAALTAEQSREAFANAIFDYCRETSNSLPHNSPKEDEQIEAALASNEIGRIQAVAGTEHGGSFAPTGMA